MRKHRKTRLTPLPTTAGHDGWDSECIYSTAADYFDSLLEGIENATFSIDLAVYIFAFDPIGEKFLNALSNKARQGVAVRLMVDGIGSADSINTIAKKLTDVGVQFRVFHPLPWHWKSFRWSLTPGSAIAKALHFVSALNRRDHRKFLIIDHATAWCGSLNISENHLQRQPPWRDYGVRVTGNAVKNLRQNFDGVWHRYERKRFSRFALRFFLSNHSSLLRRHKNRLLVKWISESRQRVWISSAYFAPSGAVIRAINRQEAGRSTCVSLPQASQM